MLLCFLFAQKALYGGATDRAGALHGVPTILHGHLFRVLHLGLLFTLDAIVLVGHSFYSLLQLEKTYIPHSGVNSTRQVHFVSLGLHLLLHLNGSAQFGKWRKERWPTAR